MLQDKNRKIDIKLIQILIFIMPFAYGLFYEFTAYIAQIVILAILVKKAMTEKKLKIYINPSSISLIIISLGYLITCIYGIDKRRINIRFFEIFSTINLCNTYNAI